MFKEWTVCASLSVTPPTPLIPLPFTYNGPGTQIFAPTTVNQDEKGQRFCKQHISCLTWKASVTALLHPTFELSDPQVRCSEARPCQGLTRRLLMPDR
jgi:hypothetical protein